MVIQQLGVVCDGGGHVVARSYGSPGFVLEERWIVLVNGHDVLALVVLNDRRQILCLDTGLLCQ